ncbi:hypothetical protein AZA_10067 [Nitrospirillum viridazoti Y2]|nr:hypothetical protein AZA_10067 [Nitrospirillum amazonense Y2]
MGPLREHQLACAAAGSHCFDCADDPDNGRPIHIAAGSGTHSTRPRLPAWAAPKDFLDLQAAKRVFLLAGKNLAEFGLVGSKYVGPELSGFLNSRPKGRCVAGKKPASVDRVK